MIRTRITSAVAVTAALCCTAGCIVEEEPEELTAEQSVALEASMEAVAQHNKDLPVTNAELRSLGESFVLAAQQEVTCTHKGIVSGIWYDADLRPVFEGSWFKLGTGDLGGTVQGQYADGHYDGSVAGPDLEGIVEGPYGDGRFRGLWIATVGEDGVLHDGQLFGRYERRNAYGGYFFGIWADCGPSPASGE